MTPTTPNLEIDDIKTDIKQRTTMWKFILCICFANGRGLVLRLDNKIEEKSDEIAETQVNQSLPKLSLPKPRWPARKPGPIGRLGRLPQLLKVSASEKEHPKYFRNGFKYDVAASALAGGVLGHQYFYHNPDVRPLPAPMGALLGAGVGAIVGMYADSTRIARKYEGGFSDKLKQGFKDSPINLAYLRPIIESAMLKAREGGLGTKGKNFINYLTGRYSQEDLHDPMMEIYWKEANDAMADAVFKEAEEWGGNAEHQFGAKDLFLKRYGLMSLKKARRARPLKNNPVPFEPELHIPPPSGEPVAPAVDEEEMPTKEYEKKAEKWLKAFTEPNRRNGKESRFSTLSQTGPIFRGFKFFNPKGEDDQMLLTQATYPAGDWNPDVPDTNEPRWQLYIRMKEVDKDFGKDVEEEVERDEECKADPKLKVAILQIRKGLERWRLPVETPQVFKERILKKTVNWGSVR